MEPGTKCFFTGEPAKRLRCSCGMALGDFDASCSASALVVLRAFSLLTFERVLLTIHSLGGACSAAATENAAGKHRSQVVTASTLAPPLCPRHQQQATGEPFMLAALAGLGMWGGDRH